MSDLIRVKDKDTGHKRTIPETHLPHGNYSVLKEDAVDPRTGDTLPPEYAAPKPAEVKPESGPPAGTDKEK